MQKRKPKKQNQKTQELNNTALNTHPVVQCTAQNSGWGERGLTPISTTTFVTKSSLMVCSVCMTQMMMQLSNPVLPALCAQPHGPGSKPDYCPPCCIKLQTERSIVQETNWPCRQRSQLSALPRGMLGFDECSELKTQPYHTQVAVCRERHGESNAAWQSSQLTLYLSQTTLGHAELRKHWENEENQVPD